MHCWKDKALDAGLLWMRILMGLTMANIGYAKVFKGGIAQLIPGVEALGFPAPVIFAWLAALSEFVGGLFIAVGLGTRPAAFFVFFTMCVAFFGALSNHPFQEKLPAFLYGIIAGTIMLTGAGRFSLDSLLCRKISRSTTGEKP
ncbi:MAG: DoxX family protein [Candidatus Omnitrophota bacterium]